MDTSQRLKQLREDKGLSQEEVAKIIGVERTTYVKWETGVSSPTRKINELSRFFGVTTDYLLGNNTLSAKEERQIESDLEDMLNSMSNAGYNSSNDDFEDIEAFKATIKSAMLQAKKIAKKKYTPKKYQKD